MATNASAVVKGEDTNPQGAGEDIDGADADSAAGSSAVNNNDKNDFEAATATTQAPAPSVTSSRGGTTAGTSASFGGKGRGGKSAGAGPGGGGRSASPVIDAVTQASLGQAAALVSGWGYHGLAGLLAAHIQLQPSAIGNSAFGKIAAAFGDGDLSSEAAAAAASASAFLSSSSSSISSSADILPSRAAVHAAATKSVADDPPWVHWSKTDMAPQLKAPSEHMRLILQQQQLRGYRMARASHGVSRGCYYFECILLPGPSAKEIAAQLPSNARLGPGLQEQLARRVQWEEQQQAQQKQQEEKESHSSTSATQHHDDHSSENAEGGSSKGGGGGSRKRKHDGDVAGGGSGSSQLNMPPPPRVGGHVRLGWSMRTGDLQAPVGYDKWSYAIRDAGGSLIHKSERQDHWGGDALEPGDVIGCAIALYNPKQSTTSAAPHDNSMMLGGPEMAGMDEEEIKQKNHIRFFKNGECLGNFVISKGKREGGEAFTGLEHGTYYPAVSSYLGGSVQTNFGPNWIYPPRKLPQGLRFQPVSDLCPPPLKPDAAVQKCAPAIKLFRKEKHQQALKEAIQEEAQVQCDAYDKFLSWHVEQIRKARSERGLSVQDLPTTVGESATQQPEKQRR